MISIKSILIWLALFGLLFGIIQTLAIDILYVFSNPKEGLQKLGYDLAQTIVNSQEVIFQSTDTILKTKDVTMIQFAISRIIASSIICLFILWLFYKVIRFFIEAPKPTDKIIILLIVFLSFYILTVIVSWSLNLKMSSYTPYYGWVYFFQNFNTIIKKLGII